MKKSLTSLLKSLTYPTHANRVIDYSHVKTPRLQFRKGTGVYTYGRRSV